MRYVHDSALPAPYLCHIIHKDPPGEPKYFPFLRHSLSVPFVLFPYDARCSVNLILLRVTFLLGNGSIVSLPESVLPSERFDGSGITLPTTKRFKFYNFVFCRKSI